MKRVLSLTVLLLIALSITAQLQVKELKLSNGMTVWLNEDHSQPKVFGAVVVKAGAKDCPNTGIAHYFEHIMFKGTDRMGTIDYEAEKPWLDSISAQYDLLSQTTVEAERNKIQQHINELSIKAADYVIPNEFNRLISKYGGSELNAGTGHDMTYYHNTFLPQFIEQWCWLNSERLITPVFRGFQGELENVYEEKNRAADGMAGAMDKIFSSVFKTQPYAYPIIGSTESLKNPRLSDMEAFYKQYYVAPNMGLILCGDITVDESLTTLLEQTFGRVQSGTQPERRYSPMPNITKNEKYEITLPIPLLSMETMVFKSPTDYDADAEAFELANKLLFNGKAGLLDSLTNEHKVMLAAAMNLSLSDAAGAAIIIIPKLLGKMKTAEERVMEQVQKIIDGQFSTTQLEALKQEMVMEAEQSMENISGRSALLVDAFSNGRSWQEVLDKVEHIRQLTKEDVIAAAKKYYSANHITLAKKYGMPEKETLQQPGYKPISPKNMDAKSAFALQLEQMPVKETAIRTVDFSSDITTRQLSDHATLYYKENPMNNIFSFTLRYKDGKLHTPKLDMLSAYLTTLGTDSLKKQQLEQAWQRIGVTMDAGVGNKTFALDLTGSDEHLQEALQLLSHFMRSVKGDAESLDEARDADKVDRKSFGKQKDDALRPMMERIAYGQRSTYLNQLSKKEIKALKSEELLSLFQELQNYDCELFYCGKKPIETVAELAQQNLPIDKCRLAMADTFRPLMQYSEPTIYFFDVPKSRQNYIISYDIVSAQPTAEQRAVMTLWEEYFGGGMSSVLFQNVREFRSLAYSTGGSSVRGSRLLHPNEPLAYVTYTGTQADKTLEAVATIDSLLRQMPMKEENLEAARQSVLNDIQNSYPDFRNVTKLVANYHLDGYTTNPDTDLSHIIPSVTAQDVEQFHRTHIANNNNRVWIIIGDRKLTDQKALSKYGKIVELKMEDVYR